MPTPPPPLPGYTDIRRGDWIERFFPAHLQPFARLARLDRPIGWWLLLLPCWWSLALTAPRETGLWMLFLVGAVVMRGAGCTLNDIIDRKFDAQVARTRWRPIPSGAVSVRTAFVFMALQMAVGAAVLFSLGRPAIELGIAILVIVGIYPFMKRITYWPQVFLGICFNWGALVAWAAATHRVEAPALALYLGGLFWTLGYDTIYAHADTADDLAIGVKSTALRLGAASRVWIGGFYGVALVCFAAALRFAGAGWPGFVGLGVLAVHFLWQVVVWRMADPAHCIAIFRSNRTAGLILVFACMATGLGFV